jgi:hypothetical protein
MFLNLAIDLLPAFFNLLGHLHTGLFSIPNGQAKSLTPLHQ